MHVGRYAPECKSRLASGPQGCEKECQERTKNATGTRMPTGRLIFLQKCALETPTFYGNHTVKLHSKARQEPTGYRLLTLSYGNMTLFDKNENGAYTRAPKQNTPGVEK